MRDKIIEMEIITRFVVTQKQERILWELSNPKKCEHLAIKRFCGYNLFKKECLKSTDYIPDEKSFNFLRSNDVYFIGESYIGKLPIENAIEKAKIGEICIIYYGKGVGFYQGEPGCGKTPRFLLIN